ncbi:MAG: nucleoside 2-deoxyribosyltransferase [Pyrinomonadaceae bacterium]|nr:nucleoside 2-deoxyribosyltransferase [Phycisphaerales bacterium]
MKRMFLAGPFKAWVDPRTHAMAERDIQLFTTVIEHFEQRGWTVHCAHKREGWGRDFMAPETCTRIDYEEIGKCDCFVAFPGSPASPGTHIELGWASAMGKKIVLLQQVGKEYAFLVQGLGEITRVQRVEYAGDAVDPVQIEQAIERFSG